MTDNDRTALERREARLAGELKRRTALTDTERQIMAARGHNGRPAKPEYKPEAEWTTTERQVFASHGRRPLVGE